MCRRRTGVGGDGVVAVGPGGEAADLRMDMWNSDGTRAEVCGNAVRCVAKLASDRGHVTSSGSWTLNYFG